jgi:hypothetical protein
MTSIVLSVCFLLEQYTVELTTVAVNLQQLASEINKRTRQFIRDFPVTISDR